MRFLRCAAVVCLLAALPALGQGTRRDGNWWRDQGETSRLAYITGFFDGTKLGNYFSYWGMKDKDENANVLGPIKSFSDYGAKYLAHVSNTQLSDGLTVFYQDYRNRKIELTEGIWLVLNTIAGTPEQEIQTMIEAYRKNAK